ncbi:MAG: hypothetical protein ACK5D5_02820 [Bacteroidota bacterium]|jgi:hypothetical protein
MKTTKKILTLIFASVILLSCEKESTTPPANSVPSDAAIDVTVEPSQLAVDQDCELDKIVILELNADHFSSVRTYSNSFAQTNGSPLAWIENEFTGLRAATYTLTVKYKKSGSPNVYTKGTYSIVISDAQAENADVIAKNYTLTTNDICY